ncbi:GNAT family protein [Kineococcus sp. NUM-3379]
MPEVPAGTWPVRLQEGALVLRPLRRRDGARWREVRLANAAWLRPWEATSPEGAEPPPTFGQMVRAFTREARAGRMLPLVVEVDGQLAGQVTVSGITWGSLRSAHVGYWIDRRFAGRGLIPLALALVGDHCFRAMGLHRLELNIRPENAASLRVVEKLGLRDEGLRERLLHIDGRWRDHRTFAVTAEEVPLGLRTRLRERAGS